MRIAHRLFHQLYAGRTRMSRKLIKSDGGYAAAYTEVLAGGCSGYAASLAELNHPACADNGILLIRGAGCYVRPEAVGFQVYHRHPPHGREFSPSLQRPLYASPSPTDIPTRVKAPCSKTTPDTWNNIALEWLPFRISLVFGQGPRQIFPAFRTSTSPTPIPPPPIQQKPLRTTTQLIV